ncbi:MAG: hypothetical protein AB7O97_01300 [Planctomycetota bacterium]
MSFRSHAPLLSLLLLPACATLEYDEGPPIYQEQMAEMREFEQEQARFAATANLPRDFEFPGQGTVTVRQLWLEGYPSNTYVRCRFHYHNDTGRPVLRTLVSLDVLDAEGQMVASKVSVLIFPTPRAIHDGTYFSDELRTQTRDAHKQAGWSWRLTCKSEFMDEDDDG